MIGQQNSYDDKGDILLPTFGEHFLKNILVHETLKSVGGVTAHSLMCMTNDHLVHLVLRRKCLRFLLPSRVFYPT